MNNTQSQLHSIQFATFHVENLLLGLSIDTIQEINRQHDVTGVPHSPDSVSGVINLRGEVVTVVDLRTLLGLKKQTTIQDSRCIIIHLQDELIGLLVDRIADTLTIPADEVEPTPSNVDGIEGRFFKGVHTLETGVVVLLDVEQLLETC